MARRLKPQEVDVLFHKGSKIVIYFDRNDLRFFAEYLSIAYYHEAAEELKKIVKSVIDNQDHLDWIPVIKVEYRKRHQNEKGEESAEIYFRFKRFYFAIRAADNRVMQSDWEILNKYENPDPNAKRDDHATSMYWDGEGIFNPPCNNASRGKKIPDEFYFRYTEKHWQDLINLRDGVYAVREKFDAIFFETEGKDLLQNLAWHLFNAAATPNKLTE